MYKAQLSNDTKAIYCHGLRVVKGPSSSRNFLIAGNGAVPPMGMLYR